MTKLSLEEFKNFWIYYNDEAHQQTSIASLYEVMPESLLSSESSWVLTYRNPPEPPPSAAIKGPVTPSLMGRMSGHAASSFDEAFCNDFNNLIRITGFDQDLTAFRMLFAQCQHETANWVYMKECGNNAYFTSMYENRSDLGNTQPGDGARFCGTGAIMVTGRANFQDSYNYLQKMDGLDDPRFMAEGSSYCADKYPFTICISWLLNNNYLEVCKKGDVEYATKILNGGYNGLEERRHFYNKACTIITSL